MSWEVQSAAWKRLSESPDIVALVEGRVYKAAPENAAFPMIELGPDEDINESADCINQYRTRLAILVWSLIEVGGGVRGPHEAQKICRAVQGVLTKSPLKCPGFEYVELEWLRTHVTQADDGRAWFGTVEFTALVEELPKGDDE